MGGKTAYSETLKVEGRGACPIRTPKHIPRNHSTPKGTSVMGLEEGKELSDFVL